MVPARTIDEVKNIRDKAEALRLYSKQVGESLEMQNAIAEIKLRAERKAGELLAEMDKNKGGGDQKSDHRGHDVTSDSKPTLEQLGIHKKQSERWQQAASIPEPVFQHHIETIKESGKELTSAGVLQVASHFGSYLSDVDKQLREERKAKIFELWLSCYTQEEIAEAVNLPRKTVDDQLKELANFSGMGKSPKTLAKFENPDISYL